MAKWAHAYVTGVFLVAAAGLLLAPYFIVDLILVTYLALFVAGAALSKAELPAWASRRKQHSKSRIVHYARWMKMSTLDSVDLLTLSPFMKAVMSEQDRRHISEERLGTLRKTTPDNPGQAPRGQPHAYEKVVPSKIDG